MFEWSEASAQSERSLHWLISLQVGSLQSQWGTHGIDFISKPIGIISGDSIDGHGSVILSIITLSNSG